MVLVTRIVVICFKKVAQQDVTKLNNFAGESERGRGKIRVRQSTAHKKGLPQEAMEIEV